MLMKPPTVPANHANAPSYDDLVRTLQLIVHATAPTPDDGGGHENAYTLAMDMLKRIEARREYEADPRVGMLAGDARRGTTHHVLTMDAAPDFEALRARRNAAVQEMHQKMADEWGVPLQSLRSNFNPTACYCACGTGGPCEHKWDGEGWESEDGCAWSATCSRCGCTAMSHDMRNAP